MCSVMVKFYILDHARFVLLQMYLKYTHSVNAPIYVSMIFCSNAVKELVAL